MSDLVQRDDVTELALARFVEQFKGAPNLEAMVSVFTERTQALEDSVWLLYTERWLDTADGVQLDALGEIVGQDREGRDDATYRLWIRARMYVNRSTGTPDDTMNVLALVAPDAEGVTLTEDPPASYRVFAYNIDDDLSEAIGQILRKVKPAGVNMQFQSSEFDVDHLFTLAPSTTLVTGDSDKGFGDATNPATGGHLTGIV